MSEASLKKTKLIGNITDDYYRWNRPPIPWIGEFALIPAVLHLLMVGLAYFRNIDGLLQSSTTIVYAISLIVAAIFFDLFRGRLSERKALLLRAIINFCCFIPLSCYCVFKCYVAAVEFGQHDVVGETFAFIYSNVIFHSLQWAYINKDFNYLQNAQKLTNADPAILTLGEKKIICVYNLIFYSTVYAFFVIEVMCYITFKNGGDALKEVLHKNMNFQQSGHCSQDGAKAFMIMFLIFAGLCLYQLIAVVKIMQAIWVLCLRKPKTQKNVLHV